MLRIYFDASALVKRYTQETGTALVNEVFRLLSPNQMTCATLGVVEIIATLVRKRNDGRLSSTLFAQAVDKFKAEVIDPPEFALASVDDKLLLSALSLLARHNLNATDAIILRSVLDFQRVVEDMGDKLILWTCDKRLVRAARSEGVSVFDPEEETIEHLHQILGMPKE